MTQQPPVGQGLLIIEDSRSYSDTPHRYDSSGRMISPTQRPIPNSTHHSQERDIDAPAGFEPAILTSERPQPHALHHVATGVGRYYKYIKHTKN